MQEIFSVKGKSGQTFEFKKGQNGDLIMRYGHEDTIEMGGANIFPASLYKGQPLTARSRALEWINGYPTAGEKVRKQIVDFAEKLATV